MGDNEVFHPRSIHLLIKDGDVSSGELDQRTPLPCSSLWPDVLTTVADFWALPWTPCPKYAPNYLLLQKEHPESHPASWSITHFHPWPQKSPAHMCNCTHTLAHLRNALTKHLWRHTGTLTNKYASAHAHTPIERQHRPTLAHLGSYTRLPGF